MTAPAPAYEHLIFAAGDDPVIGRTGFKAMHLIREHVAWGWSAEELALNHPQLRLGEIYATLAWYADHAADVEAKLADELIRADAAHAQPGQRRLARLLKRTAA